MKCEACERGDHFNCGMQTWCECDCDGPDSIDFGPDYDPTKDVEGCFALAYSTIRERKAAGGKGWPE